MLICFLLVFSSKPSLLIHSFHRIMLTKGEKNQGRFQVPDNCLHTPPCERKKGGKKSLFEWKEQL